MPSPSKNIDVNSARDRYFRQESDETNMKTLREVMSALTGMDQKTCREFIVGFIQRDEKDSGLEKTSICSVPVSPQFFQNAH